MTILCVDAGAQSSSNPPRIVTWNCSGCHGVDGRAQLAYVPRLAGQHQSYLETRLVGFQASQKPPVDELFHHLRVFRSPSRENGDGAGTVNMIGVAHAASAEELKAAAGWYAAQKPTAVPSAGLKAGSTAAAIFQSGVSGSEVPACQSCHGPAAEGTDKAPRLQGQNETYTLNRLQHFRSANPANGSAMISIAKHLDADQSRAIASYLKSLN